MLGFNAGVPRSPLTELEPVNKDILWGEIKKAGLKGI